MITLVCIACLTVLVAAAPASNSESLEMNSLELGAEIANLTQQTFLERLDIVYQMETTLNRVLLSDRVNYREAQHIVDALKADIKEAAADAFQEISERFFQLNFAVFTNHQQHHTEKRSVITIDHLGFNFTINTFEKTHRSFQSLLDKADSLKTSLATAFGPDDADDEIQKECDKTIEDVKQVIIKYNSNITSILHKACKDVNHLLVGTNVGVDEYGNRYAGEFNANGDWHGNGTLYFYNGDKYTGEFHNDSMTGRGVLITKEGGRYDGQFVNNQLQGHGLLVLPSGDRLEGDFFNDELDGKGVLILRNGGRYEGDLKNGMMTGQGVLTYPSGHRYEGSFLQNRMDGKGRLVLKGGDVYEGEFKDGDIYGRCVITFTTGNRYEGELVDGMCSGEGVYSFANGDRYEGSFRRGKINGRGVFYYGNGKRYEGVFKDNNVVEEDSFLNTLINTIFG